MTRKQEEEKDEWRLELSVSLSFNEKVSEVVEPMRMEVRKVAGEVIGATKIKLRENRFKRGEGINQEVILVIPKRIETGEYQIRIEVGGARTEGEFSLKVVPRGLVDSYHIVFVIEYLRHAHRAPLF